MGENNILDPDHTRVVDQCHTRTRNRTRNKIWGMYSLLGVNPLFQGNVFPQHEDSLSKWWLGEVKYLDPLPSGFSTGYEIETPFIVLVGDLCWEMGEGSC